MNAYDKLLKDIDKRIVHNETEAHNESDNLRRIFLEGKVSGLNEAYRLIKITRGEQ